MSGIIAKMYQDMKRLLNKKGQGLVELALIFAFCVGVGMVARDSGILDALNDSFNQGVSAFLTDAVGDGGSGGGSGSGSASGSGSGNESGSGSGNGSGSGSGNESGSDSGSGSGSGSGNESGSGSGNGSGSGSGSGSGVAGVAGVGVSGFDWGVKDPTTYYNKEYNDDGHAFTQVASQEDRLAADQQTLVNLAKFFLGKTQSDIIHLLKGEANKDGKDYTADMASNQEVLLGHFVPYDTTKKGMRFKTDKGYLNKSESENIFAWMQGIYTDIAEDKDTVVENDNYNHDRLYLVSDYIVSQTWADRAGSYQENGARIKFEYDYSGSYIYPESYNTAGAVKVVGVQLSIDPRSQHNTTVNNNLFNERHSEGLEVHVRLVKDENGEDSYQVTFKDTGVATTSGNNGMTNWYGDDLLNKPSDWKKTCVASKVKCDISNGGTYDFEKGDIIQFGPNYYIAVKEKKNLTIQKYDSTGKNGWMQKHIEYKNSYQNGTLESQIFVKITGTVSDTGSYIVENAKVSFDNTNNCYPKKQITWRGWPVILGSGEVYLYVGDVQPTVYTGIDEENFIKLR